MTDTLVHFIRNELLLPSQADQLQTDEDLWATGLLTSLQFMRLISFVESQWAFSIPSEDMVLEHFQTIDCMSLYINARTSTAGIPALLTG